MSYLHISNLYKDQRILLFKRVFCLEKIHGTSAHIAWKDGKLSFFSGGESYDKFVALFNSEFLTAQFNEKFGALKDVTIFGEAYGGKQQGMSETYGKDLKFIVFDVQIGDCWLNVTKAHDLVNSLNLEFVDYVETSTDINELDEQKMKDSTQAIRNGIGSGKMREGIVIRPLEEFTYNTGERVIAKHKRDEFRETTKKRPIIEPSKLQVLEDANKISEEWVTAQRLEHVLQKIENPTIDKMPIVIVSMRDDILREGEGEIVVTKEVLSAIARETAKLFKQRLKKSLYDEPIL